MKKKILLLMAVATMGLTAATLAQVPSYVPTNGLVGYWPFNGNANDESGNGNNGTINGATLSTDRDGLINSSINETNDGSYIRTQNIITNAPNTFSISLWANPSQDDIVIAQGVNGNEGLGTMSIIHPTHGGNWGNTSLNAGVGINVGRNQIQIVEHSHLYVASPLVYSTQIQGWHHIVLIYDQHVPKLYLDGNLVSVGLQSSIQNVHPSSGFCSYYAQSGFGNSFNPNGTPIGNYKGDFDDIGIWNRALTQQEITDLYNGGCQLSVSTQPANQTININNNAQFIVGSSDTNATYQWQTNLGVGFQNLSNAGQYSGTANDTLSVSNVSMSNNNQQFRCIISAGSCKDTSKFAVLSINNNVGINENTHNNLFSVFPNPAQNIMHVKADNKLIGSVFTIYDNIGKVVKSGKLNTANTSIELGNLSSGFYMFSVGENRKQSFKIIKE